MTMNHDSNSSVATDVSLDIDVSFQGNVSSTVPSPGSVYPDVILQNELKVGIYKLHSLRSCNLFSL